MATDSAPLKPLHSRLLGSMRVRDTFFLLGSH
jgi:hypothetical protein